MELFLLHCNSHGIDDEIESIIFIALVLLRLCLPDRSAATLVACLDIDVIYLIFDMQFSRCSPDCFTSHPVSGTS
mgnify:CR=1 FL=1